MRRDAASAPVRPQSSPGIVIHWWGEPSGQSHQQVVDHLAGSNTIWSSAHYVVSGDRVTQLVSLDDTAFHAGVYDINAQSVGIECRPEMDDATVDRVRDLVTRLRSRYGALWLEPHKAFSSTDCPGTYMDKIPELKVLAAGSSSLPSTPKAESGQGILTVDGYWGSTTTRRLQELSATPVDGVVSGQNQAWKATNPGLVSGWEWVPSDAASGSAVIRCEFNREWGWRWMADQPRDDPSDATALRNHPGWNLSGEIRLHQGDAEGIELREVLGGAACG